MRNSRVGRAQQPELGTHMHTDGTVEVAGVSDGWPGRAWVFGWTWMEHKVLLAWSLIYGDHDMILVSGNRRRRVTSVWYEHALRPTHKRSQWFCLVH